MKETNAAGNTPSSGFEPPIRRDAILAGVGAVLKSAAADVGRARELLPLLAATKARAVGCWRHREGELILAGFLAVDEMPAAVQAEFVSATQRVSLEQTNLGIVQAATSRGPAVNHRLDDPNRPAAGSVGWLARFEAASSLAVPLMRGNDLAGALAVATPQRIENGDDVWRLVMELAAASVA